MGYHNVPYIGDAAVVSFTLSGRTSRTNTHAAQPAVNHARSGPHVGPCRGGPGLGVDQDHRGQRIGAIGLHS